MCGRFTIAIDADTYGRFRIVRGSIPPVARFNVAPSQEVPVVRQVAPGENEILAMKWGLVPFWVRDPKLVHPVINARAETLLEKPAFRDLVRHRRCLVPATGFYEWKRTDRKRPFYVRLKNGSPFAFAGLYDIWRDPGGRALFSFAIITIEPNELVKDLHSRMPAVLKRDEEETWLSLQEPSPDELRVILSPYPSEEMEAYEVGTQVNNPENEGPELIGPVRRKHDSSLVDEHRQ